MPVDTEGLAQKYRAATLDPQGERILLTNFRGSQQEQDLTDPPNCQGFGRVRHFRRNSSKGWPTNPLPIDPAHSRLGLPRTDELRAQVFQNSACNWRCWYCFVPYNLLSADSARSAWISAPELVDMYLKEGSRPAVIDLSGGQPELTPEWVPWMIDAIEERGLGGSVYLWSDDNLSCDYFWRYLSTAQQERVATYPYYGRVACFKGFDEESFEFNTRADRGWFGKQFELMSRLVGSGMDVYAYVTFTTPMAHSIGDSMRTFVDRLQDIDENLPLRTIPLEVQEFSPVTSRLTDVRRAAFVHQWAAVEAWQEELGKRFNSQARSLAIDAVELRSAFMKVS